MAAMPLYGCRCCVTRDAIVFCLPCAVRLCLHCDAAVHGADAAAWLHERAPLCDACGDAAGATALRCAAASATLCTGCCQGGGAPPPSGIISWCVTRYTGCPEPTELVRLISVEAPQPQQDFEAWLAEKLLEEHQDHQVLLPEATAAASADCYWDVALETARLEKMVADCCHTEPPPPPPAATASAHDNQPPPQGQGQGQGRDQEAIISAMAIAKKKKQQLERERAKLRYNDKKERRKILQARHVCFPQGPSRHKKASQRPVCKGFRRCR